MRFLRRPRINENWQAKLYLRLVVLTLLVAYAIAFVLENGKHVAAHFVFATARVSLVWLILLCFVIGVVAGVLLGQLDRRRRRRREPRDERSEPGDAVDDLGR